MHHSKDERSPFTIDVNTFTRLFVICPKTLKEEDLERAFGEFGKIENLHMPRDRNTGDSKGIAYVHFSKVSEAANALEKLHGTTIKSANRPLKVMIAANKNDQNQSSNINLDKYRRLFIVVPKLADEEDIREHFSSFGTVEYVNIQKDKITKENKGFAYVQFETFAQTARALEECDKKYKAVIARPREDLKRDRSNFELNTSFGSNVKSTVPKHYANDSFFSRDDDFFNMPTSHRPLSDGYKSVVVMCSPKLTQKHIETLFDIVQGMENCQYSVDLYAGCGKGIITYSSHMAAAYAVQKLDKFEYPLGEIIHVKPEINQINKVAENLSAMVDNFKSAIASGKPTSELAQLAEVMAHASSIIKAVTSSVADDVLPERNNFSPNNSICNVNLPSPKPMAGPSAAVAQRCFIVFKREPPPMPMLRDVFSRFEGLIKIYLVPNKNFGYVLYASEQSAREAIKTLHNCTVGSIHMKVLEADERTPRGDDAKDQSKKMKLDTMETEVSSRLYHETPWCGSGSLKSGWAVVKLRSSTGFWPLMPQVDEVLHTCEVGSGSTLIKEELDIEETAIQIKMMFQTEVDFVPIEWEAGEDGTLIKEELHIDRTFMQSKAMSGPPSQNVMVDIPIEWEVGADSTLVKEELCIDSTTTQPRTPSHSHLQDMEPTTSTKWETSSENIYSTTTPQDYEVLVEPTSSKLRSKEQKSSKRTKTRKEFICEHCDYKTSKWSLLQKHMRIHTKIKSYKCKYCDYIATERGILRRHVRSHAAARRFKCEHCHYSSTQKSHLQGHMRIHTGVKPFKCGHCDYSATEHSSLRKHLRIHTGEKPYKCGHCDYSASNSSHLQVHLRIHTGVRPYKCEHCDYSAIEHGSLRKHMRIHTGEKPYRCEYCDYSASNNSRLQVHLRIHTGIKPYKCEHCDYSATVRSTLNKHVRVHTGEKPYKCVYCDYCASQNSHLRGHLRIHTGVRPYKCEHCDYTATEYSSLYRHMRRHTGEKPYQCEFCNYSATQSSHLQGHMRIHTGIRPYKCEHCDYSATERGTLQKHLRIHTGEKPYRCAHCDYSTTQSSHLRGHIMRIHTEVKL